MLASVIGGRGSGHLALATKFHDYWLALIRFPWRIVAEDRANV